MLERILNLMEARGVKAATLTRETGLNHSALNSWKIGKAKPSYGALVKIAEYFNVSVEYLQGNTDDPVPHEKEAKKNAAEKLGDAVIEALIKAGKISPNEPITPELVDSIVKVVDSVASFKA